MTLLAALGAWLLATAGRAALVLLVALGCVRLLGRRRAALRHDLAAGALLGALALPLLRPLAPSLAVPSPFVLDPLAPWLLQAVAACWAAGALVVLVRGARARLALDRLAGGAEPVVDGPSLALLDSMRARLGLRRRVHLLAHADVSSPLTFGVLEPVVLVPRAWPRWHVDRRRAVLVHELAHVVRLDALLEDLLLVARAAFWFLPPLWSLERDLREAREVVCDASVVAAGARASRYAGLLLRLARAIRGAQPVTVGLLHRRPDDPTNSGRTRAGKALARRLDDLLRQDQTAMNRPLTTRLLLLAPLALLALPAAGLDPAQSDAARARDVVQSRATEADRARDSQSSSQSSTQRSSSSSSTSSQDSAGGPARRGVGSGPQRGGAVPRAGARRAADPARGALRRGAAEPAPHAGRRTGSGRLEPAPLPPLPARGGAQRGGAGRLPQPEPGDLDALVEELMRQTMEAARTGGDLRARERELERRFEGELRRRLGLPDGEGEVAVDVALDHAEGKDGKAEARAEARAGAKDEAFDEALDRVRSGERVGGAPRAEPGRRATGGRAGDAPAGGADLRDALHLLGARLDAGLIDLVQYGREVDRLLGFAPVPVRRPAPPVRGERTPRGAGSGVVLR